MKGIDVSIWQGDIDWNKVQRAGIKFAMIKASEGTNIVDPKFIQNITAAHRAGIACGVYHFFNGTTIAAAIQEADWFIQTIAPYEDCIKLWACIDVEGGAQQQISAAQLTDCVITFLERVKIAGFKPMIYSNRNFIMNHYEMERLNGYPLWYACWYEPENENDKPQHGFDYKIWQYGVGYVDGIGGQVDMDFGYFELPSSDVIAAGDIVKIRSGACYYGTNIEVPDFVIQKEWVADDVSGTRVFINEATDGTKGLNSAVYSYDCRVIGNINSGTEIPEVPTEPDPEPTPDPEPKPENPPVEVPPVDDGEPTTSDPADNDNPPPSTDNDTKEDDDKDDESEDEKTLVNFFKLMIRALLIAVRSLFGKGGNS